jgi:hypothetical protein
MSWGIGDDALRPPSQARGPDPSRSRFHGCGEEKVEGAAIETVLLLRDKVFAIIHLARDAEPSFIDYNLSLREVLIKCYFACQVSSTYVA